MELIIICVNVVAFCINLYLWKRRPHDGQIVVTTDRAGKKLFSLELDKSPEELETMKRVSFKVVSSEVNGDIVDLEDDVTD